MESQDANSSELEIRLVAHHRPPTSWHLAEIQSDSFTSLSCSFLEDEVDQSSRNSDSEVGYFGKEHHPD